MKNILIAVLVVVIIVIGYLFIKEKTKPVDYGNAWPETEPAIPTNNNSAPVSSSQSSITSNTYTVTEVPSGEHIFETSAGNPSARATDREFIIAAKLTNQTSIPTCGKQGKFGSIPKCLIYMKDYLGNVRKISEWPTEEVKEKYPNLFLQWNVYLPGEALFADNETLSFTSKREDGCSGYYKEYWHLNYSSGEYTLMSSERIMEDNC